jgi:hypothetical protein
MATIYKIHPSIGIARVGKHPTAFFIGPEEPGLPGVEIASDGSESPVVGYKAGGMLKRQAARFRVYEYEIDTAGGSTLTGEVTADRATIEWQVDLVNRKAALNRSPAPGDHPAEPRNTEVSDRSTLILRDPQARPIAGKNQQGAELHGSFLGKDVYLGELRTDGSGRLLVLGGRGVSESVPAGRPLPDFANNDGWHDDVADGPVTATVTLAGQAPFRVQQQAWVVVAPPDFAPGIGGIVTLFDVAMQAAFENGAHAPFPQPDPQPSFRRHIRPVIERAANLRWVNDWTRWSSLLPLDWNALADPGMASKPLRQRVGTLLEQPGLDRFIMPDFLQHYVDQWIAGDFINDLNGADKPQSQPAALDRAALEACVGAGFFPGIEASITLRDKTIYVEPCRLDPAQTAKVYAGCLTEIMAVPWQADFAECSGGNWWPSQRPDFAMLDPARVPGSQVDWANPIGQLDHRGMVDNVERLGFIVPAGAGNPGVFVEADRDPQFKRK